MLHVVLLILKILGIILLSILVLLLLILCAVLFVSVTYRVHVEKKETLQVSAVGGWMFRALSVHYSLDGANDWKQDLRVKVFGITVLNLFGEKKPKKKRKRRKERPPERETAPKERAPMVEGKAQSEAQELPEPPSLPAVIDSPEGTKSEGQGSSGQQNFDQKGSGQQRSGRRNSGRPKKPPVTLRIRWFFAKLLYAIRSICGKIKEIGKNLRETVRHLWKRKEELLEFWNLEEHRRARSAIYKELRYLWKKSRPRRIEGELKFGFEDPSLTGMCMGALSVLYAWYPKKFRLLPDFEQEILEGRLLIKGRIRLYTAALILLRVWFNQDIRHMYEHWQEL